MDFRYILILWVLLFAFAQVPGRLEGQYFPVLTDISVTLEEDGDGDPNTTNIFLNFNKERDSCALRTTRFYLYDVNEEEYSQFALMDARFMGYEQVRFAGRYDGVGPWYVRASKEDLANMSIVLRHKCHIYYETITRVRIRDGVIRRISAYES